MTLGKRGKGTKDGKTHVKPRSSDHTHNRSESTKRIKCFKSTNAYQCHN